MQTQALLEKIKTEQKNIALPIPVVAEFLSGLDADATEEFYRTLLTEFVLLPFDEKSALVYARIMQNRHKDGIWKTYREKERLPRRFLADIAILATAEAHGVPLLYAGERSNNFIDSMAQAAGLSIRVENLHNLHFQYPLPNPDQL